jgi:mRNA interferase YafQ
VFILKYSNQFKKDLKRYKHDAKTLSELQKILDLLRSGASLPEKNKNHQLPGNLKGYFECHIKPDMLLVYKKEKDELLVLIVGVGTHSKLFND